MTDAPFPTATAPTAKAPTMTFNKSDSIAALATALAAAQGAMKTAVKDSFNPHFKNKYADLASVWDACRDALSANGLSIMQPVSGDGVKVTVTTLLAHKSGEWMSDSLTMTAQQNTPQGIVACITYCRRTALAAMVGVAPDDDQDGEAPNQERRRDENIQQNPAQQARATVARAEEFIQHKAAPAAAATAAAKAPAPAAAPTEHVDGVRKQAEAKALALKAIAGENFSKLVWKACTTPQQRCTVLDMAIGSFETIDDKMGPRSNDIIGDIQQKHGWPTPTTTQVLDCVLALQECAIGKGDAQ